MAPFASYRFSPFVMRAIAASMSMLPGPVSNAVTSGRAHPAGSSVMFPMPPIFCSAVCSVPLR